MWLIDADELLKEDFTEIFVDPTDQPIFEWIISQTPSIDAVPVVHGRWMPTPEYDSCWCSRCKKQYTGFFASYWNYCPNCGARMDGE